MVRFTLMITLFACGSDSENSALRATSVPVAESPVALDLGGLRRPDGKEPLIASQLRLEDIAQWVPGAGDLEPGEVQVLLDAVNQTTAACEPCMTEGMSLGACAKRWLSSCTNLPSLISRAFRVAIQGGDLDQAQQAISFVEPWQPVQSKAAEDNKVHVTFVVDYRDPFSHGAWQAWEALEKDYGDSLEFSVLHLPQERHEDAREISLLALRARQAGKELAFHRAVMAAGERTPVADIEGMTSLWEGVPELESAVAEQLLSRDGNTLRELGVETTPVVWVNGYRVSGQRSVGVLQRFVDLALAD